MKNWYPLIVGFVTFTTYLVSILISHGVLKSISDSDYWNKKPFKFMFELTMFICGLTIAYYGYVTGSPLMVIGGAGIFSVGLFPRFKKNLFTKTMHYVFAIGGFALTSLSFWIDLGQWYLTVIIAAAVLFSYLGAEKHKIFYIEVSLAYCILLSLAYNIFGALKYLL